MMTRAAIIGSPNWGQFATPLKPDAYRDRPTMAMLTATAPNRATPQNRMPSTRVQQEITTCVLRTSRLRQCGIQNTGSYATLHGHVLPVMGEMKCSIARSRPDMLKNMIKNALAMMPPCTSRMVTCAFVACLQVTAVCA